MMMREKLWNENTRIHVQTVQQSNKTFFLLNANEKFSLKSHYWWWRKKVNELKKSWLNERETYERETESKKSSKREMPTKNVVYKQFVCVKPIWFDDKNETNRLVSENNNQFSVIHKQTTII